MASLASKGLASRMMGSRDLRLLAHTIIYPRRQYTHPINTPITTP